MYRYLVAVLVCLCVLATANAAKLGDKGKGWKVKRDKKTGYLYCQYNGKFKLAPDSNSCRQKGAVIGFSDPDQGCPKFHPVTIKSSSDVREAPTSVIFTIKPRRKGYNIIAQNGCVAKYLSLGEDPTKQDEGADADVELDNSSKWTWAVSPNNYDEDSIDCLNNVDIMSQKYRTSLSPNGGCTNLIYDGDESDWTLIPV